MSKPTTCTDTAPPVECVVPITPFFSQDWFVLTHPPQNQVDPANNLAPQFVNDIVMPCFTMIQSTPDYKLPPLSPFMWAYDSSTLQLTLVVDAKSTTIPPAPTNLPTFKLVTTYITSSNTYTNPIFVDTKTENSDYIDKWGFRPSSGTASSLYYTNGFFLHPARNLCTSTNGTKYWCLDTVVTLQPDKTTQLAVLGSTSYALLVTNFAKNSTPSQISSLDASILETRRACNGLMIVNALT